MLSRRSNVLRAQGMLGKSPPAVNAILRSELDFDRIMLCGFEADLN